MSKTVEMIGRFEIEEEIGRGAMGVVYRGFDPVLKRRVAVKLMAPHLISDTAAQARFHREAALVAKLKHTHIAVVYDFGEYEKQPYIAMEWVEGVTLKELLQKDGAMPLERALSLFDQLSSALDYAHKNGIIHRDLKPANILVGEEDNTTIVDFGLAVLDSGSTITATGMALGTPVYMSPEQIMGVDLDGRADQYSLAIVLYEMLAGQPPFVNSHMPALFQQQLYGEPPPITEHNPTLPQPVEKALVVALSKQPKDRFESTGAFSRALQIVDAPIIHLPKTTKRNASRWPLPIIALLMALVGWLAYLQFATGDDEADTNVETVVGETLTENAARVAGNATPVSNESDEPELAPPYDFPFWSAEWRMPGSDPIHSRWVEYEWLVLDTSPRWEQSIDGDSTTGFSIVDSYIFMPVEDRLVAYDWTTGEEVWQTSLGATLSTAPTLGWADDDAYVLLSTEEGELYIFTFYDGQLKWRLGRDKLNGIIRGGVVIVDEYDLLTITDSGNLLLIDPVSAEIHTIAHLPDYAPFNQPPTANNIAVFLVGENNDALAVDHNSGDIAWHADLAGAPTTPAVIVDSWGAVAIGTDQGWVQTLSMVTGQVIWETELSAPVTGIAADNDNIYISTQDGTAYTFAADGKLVWEYTVDETISAALIINDDFMVLTAESGTLYYLSLEDGQPDESLQFELGESATVLPVGSWLFARTYDALYAFGPAEKNE